ncbi:MAG: WYL domain-containing protein [Bacteroidales bacterium]|nr:WYL domain-containing protein [Bacteroidales bacterium]
MSKRDYIIRYLIIVKKLRNSRLATFNEINDYIMREFELMEGPRNISLRTFQRDLNEIRTIFNIDIKCNNSNQYYIVEEENSGFNNRMIEAFDIINSLSVGQKLSPHIILEKRCPLGTEHLHGLLHAIRNLYVVRFKYQKYYEPDITSREVEPYTMKEFRGRWYILSKDYKDENVKTFALDRIHDLEISMKKFIYPSDIDPNEYFKNCFGVMTSNESSPEEIILSFEPLQGKYIKSYPLHESQKILRDDGYELLVHLTMFVTHDFFMELLSYGENVKVIKPDNLISDLKTSYQDALNLY